MTEHSAANDAVILSAATELAHTIAEVTDLWHEPLDEVHDIPPIVNAILAAGWRPPMRSDDRG